MADQQTTLFVQARQALVGNHYIVALTLYSEQYGKTQDARSRRLKWLAQDAQHVPGWFDIDGISLLDTVEQLPDLPSKAQAAEVAALVVRLQQVIDTWPKVSSLRWLLTELKLLEAHLELQQPLTIPRAQQLPNQVQSLLKQLEPAFVEAPDLSRLRETVQAQLRTTRPLQDETTAPFDPLQAASAHYHAALEQLDPALLKRAEQELPPAERLNTGQEQAALADLKAKIHDLRTALHAAEGVIQRARRADDLDHDNPGRAVQRYRLWQSVQHELPAASWLPDHVAQLEQELRTSLLDRLQQLQQRRQSGDPNREAQQLADQEELDSIEQAAARMSPAYARQIAESIAGIRIASQAPAGDAEVSRVREEYAQALENDLVDAHDKLNHLRSLSEQGASIPDLTALQQRYELAWFKADVQQWAARVRTLIDEGSLDEAKNRIVIRRYDSDTGSGLTAEQAQFQADAIAALDAMIERAHLRIAIESQLARLEQAKQPISTAQIEALRIEAQTAGLDSDDTIFARIDHVVLMIATFDAQEQTIRQLLQNAQAASGNGDIPRSLALIEDARAQANTLGDEAQRSELLKVVDNTLRDVTSDLDQLVTTARNFDRRDASQRAEAERLLAQAEQIAPAYPPVQALRSEWMFVDVMSVLDAEEQRLLDLKDPIEIMSERFWSANRDDQRRAIEDARQQLQIERVETQLTDLHQMIAQIPAHDPRHKQCRQRQDELFERRMAMCLNLALCADDMDWFDQVYQEAQQWSTQTGERAQTLFLPLRESVRAQNEALTYVRQHDWVRAIESAEHANKQVSTIGSGRTNQLLRDIQQAQGEAPQLQQEIDRFARQLRQTADPASLFPILQQIEAKLRVSSILSYAYEDEIVRQVRSPYRELWAAQAAKVLHDNLAPANIAAIETLIKVAPADSELEPPVEHLTTRIALIQAKTELDNNYPRKAQAIIATLPLAVQQHADIQSISDEIELKLKQIAIRRRRIEAELQSKNYAQALEFAREIHKLDPDDAQIVAFMHESEAKLFVTHSAAGWLPYVQRGQAADWKTLDEEYARLKKINNALSNDTAFAAIVQALGALITYGHMATALERSLSAPATPQEREQHRRKLQEAKTALEQPGVAHVIPELVAAVAPAFNRLQTLAHLLRPIVDNGTAKGSLEALEERLHEIDSAQLASEDRRSTIAQLQLAATLKKVSEEINQAWSHALEKALTARSQQRVYAVDTAIAVLPLARQWHTVDVRRAELLGEAIPVLAADLHTGVDLAVDGKERPRSLMLLAGVDDDTTVRARLLSRLGRGMGAPARASRLPIWAGGLVALLLLCGLGAFSARGLFGFGTPIATPTSSPDQPATETTDVVAVVDSVTPTRATATSASIVRATSSAAATLSIQATPSPSSTLAPTFTPVPPTATPEPTTPTATATPLPTATARPRPTATPTPRLRFVKLNDNDDPTCISIRVIGIDTTGWRFVIDGVAVNGVQVNGSFRGGDARACGVGPRQIVTVSVLNAQGAVVTGGSGVASNGGAIMQADWR